jgi:DNA mismatch repair protein MutL
MAIEILPDDIVAQIAAGEVVERPASVVKELIENALDADARSLHIAVNEGGRRLIRVSDDGSGINPREIELSIARHATSKLRTVDDLSEIRTLGFRGEALSSIAAVSRFAITSRHRDQDMGMQMRVDGGKIVQRQPVGAPAGTVISVENLFYNTPARLKFLKKESTEKRQITALVTRYAMAYSHVRFTLEQDGRELFRSSGSGELADVMVRALGLDSFRRMVEVSADDPARDGRPAVAVYGYASMPDFNRSDRTSITLFVNGRWVQDSSLTYAVIQAYHTLLMNGRYPVAVLMIEIAPAEVDVNVHPTKAEVRFRDANAIFAAVQRAVRETVIRLAGTPAVRGGRGGMFTTSTEREPVWGGSSMSATQLDMDLPLEDFGQYPQQRRAPAREETDPTAIPEGPEGPARPRTLPMLRVIGQVGAMYIVAEGPAGLYLVDQHAAHERILYEQYMDSHNRQELIVQHTLAAQTIDLAPTEARLIEEKLDILNGLGFVLEPFGPNTFSIRAVPALLADSDPAEVIRRILDDLELDKAPGRGAMEEKIIRQVCRYGAVKAGQVLSYEEMQQIIRQLERCQSPHTCPHGRPTMLHMSGEQLAREFGRG